jgi:hypothetical protein
MSFDLQTVFAVAGKVAMLGWILLIFAPFRKPTVVLVHRGMLPVLLSVAYALLIFPAFFYSQGGFRSLAAVKMLMSEDKLLLAGWIHYLALDLFLGAWILRQSKGMGVPHLLMVPVLVVTFLFGPAGLLSLFIIKGFYRKPLV